MPSTKNPSNVVNPGPGKLSSGVATASAFIFPAGGGGGGSAALHAHIIDPMDAHMATAIGIPATDPISGVPILASSGGPIDGESVYDFIAAAKDLFPIRPNVLGYAKVGLPNSGQPGWDLLKDVSLGGYTRTGGFTRGSVVIPTHYLFGMSGTPDSQVQGNIYPADRGILAIYHNTNGNFLDAAHTTLVAALWLGPDPAPSGVPRASFDETLREGQQLDHIASYSGIDLISLVWRLPYLKDYSSHGMIYANYDTNFYHYQLGIFGYTFSSIGAKDTAGSLLVVHWRETYALTLASIQPTAMATHLTGVYCYSATPVSGDFDDNEVSTLNRRNIYHDDVEISQSYGGATISIVASPTTVPLSGVHYYSNGLIPLHWNAIIKIDDLFTNCYYTGMDAGAQLPAGFLSSFYPLIIDFRDFGGSPYGFNYYDLHRLGSGTNYSLTNPPADGDTVTYTNANMSIMHSTPFVVTKSPTGGYGQLKGTAYKPFVTDLPWTHSQKYLFNSCAQTGGGTGSTTVKEPFTDEKYRYIWYPSPLATDRIIPVGGNIYDSTHVLIAGDVNLQVCGSQLVYPHFDFSSGCSPAGQPNYASVLSSDALNHVRYYERAFDTGIPRNIGKLRIQGLRYSDIISSVANPSALIDGHSGGAIILIKVPGVTGWLDLGRDYGVPDLNTALDFRGCKTGLTPDASSTDFTVTFNTGAFTSDNGFGEFPLFVSIAFFKNGLGQALVMDAITWEAP